MKKKPKKISHYTACNLLVFSLILMACASLKLKWQPETGFNEWRQFGKTPQHTNTVNDSIRFPMTKKWEHKTSLAVGPSLIAFDDALFFHTYDGKISAVKISSGKGLGTLKLKKKQVGTFAFADSTLVIVRRQWQPTLQRYHLQRGETMWEINGGNSFAEPLINNDRIYVAFQQKKLICYKLENGEMDWSADLPSPSHTTPTWANGKVVVGTNQGTLYAVQKGNIKWSFRTGGALRASATCFNGTLFVGSTDGIFYALNVETGKELWSFKTKGKIYQTAAIHDQNVIFGATDHNLYCLNRRTGEAVWTFTAGSVISTNPVSARNAIFVGSLDKNLYAIDPVNGKKLWSFTAKGRIRTHPIILNRKVLFGSEEERIYCFE